jgi:hypothetical protein
MPIVGGQVGCNVPHERWVFGIDGTLSYPTVAVDASLAS